MKEREDIPEVVVRRLPKYYRCLKELEREGITRVSSGTIARRLNITASQVRQDFSHYGGFGHQGYGYEVTYLKNEIKGIIGLDKKYNMVIVGAGHIGKALMNYSAFEREGFSIVAAFDIAKDIANVPENIPLYNIEELGSYVKKNRVDIAVLAVQKEKAREVFEVIKDAEIKAVWNFTPVEFLTDKDCVVENINMNDSLFTLSYMIGKE